MQGKEVRFVRGQVAHTVKGPKFVEGETVMTPDGLKFVVGVSVACTDNNTNSSAGSKFVCGTLIDAGGERAQFMQVRTKLSVSWKCNRMPKAKRFNHIIARINISKRTCPLRFRVSWLASHRKICSSSLVG